jgi:hypothetical protein
MFSDLVGSTALVRRRSEACYIDRDANGQEAIAADAEGE